MYEGSNPSLPTIFILKELRVIVAPLIFSRKRLSCSVAWIALRDVNIEKFCGLTGYSREHVTRELTRLRKTCDDLAFETKIRKKQRIRLWYEKQKEKPSEKNISLKKEVVKVAPVTKWEEKRVEVPSKPSIDHMSGYDVEALAILRELFGR